MAGGSVVRGVERAVGCVVSAGRVPATGARARAVRCRVAEVIAAEEA